MTCPKCKNEIPEGMKFCPSCGYAVPQNNVCSNCGKEIPEGMNFCPLCGFEIKDSIHIDLSKNNINIKSLIINLISIFIICLFSFYNLKMICILINAKKSNIESFVNGIYSNLSTSDKTGCFDIISETDRQYIPEYFLQSISDDVKEYKELEQILPNYDHWRGLVKGYNQEYEKAEIKAIENTYSFSSIFFDLTGHFYRRAFVYVLITTHDINQPSIKSYIQAELILDYENSDWKVTSISLKNLPNGCNYRLDICYDSDTTGHFQIENN